MSGCCESATQRQKALQSREKPGCSCLQNGIFMRGLRYRGNPVMQTPGDSKMRKGALLLAVLMVATAPTVAFAAKKAAGPKKYDTKADNMNESSARLVRDGMMQFMVPTQSNMKLAQAASTPKAAKAKKAKKSKNAKKAKKGKAKKK
jgi:hypothetical protein